MCMCMSIYDSVTALSTGAAESHVYAVYVLLFVLLLSLLTLIQCVSPQSLSEMVQDVFISLEKKIT